MRTEWYKEDSFYQIWIRSFKDGNGDGIGDLKGVLEKLEYVKSLGVDGIWFSPIYPSPNADYGYDISDYCGIHPDYGTMDEFREVLLKAHELGLKVVMDLVINHTSDEHPWFKESRKSRTGPYADYYHWKDRPNNWDSFFEGKAWTYCPERDQYYLHLFSVKQPDLNMDNPEVREEVKRIMRFWLDMGVDGFREDVITYISKREGLPDGWPVPILGAMHHYKDGPHIHEYLREFRAVTDDYDVFQVGEGPMTWLRTAKSYLTGPGKSLDMMISFDHMVCDCLFTEYIPLPFSLLRYKRALSRWQYGLAGKAWNALYIENHDHPRVISRYGSEEYRKESGKTLAASYLFLQGTPFIYQGQEIGMTNIRLPDINDYADVSTRHNFSTYHLKKTIEERMEYIYRSSRDSARTPLQWSGGKNAGFTDAETAWFAINGNFAEVNVEEEEKDPLSILHFYREALALRKREKALLYGKYRLLSPLDRHFFAYERTYGGEKEASRENSADAGGTGDRRAAEEQILVVCHFGREPGTFRVPRSWRGRKARLILDTENRHTGAGEETLPDKLSFGAYGAQVYKACAREENHGK